MQQRNKGAVFVLNRLVKNWKSDALHIVKLQNYFLNQMLNHQLPN